jgi:hypothetical protein
MLKTRENFVNLINENNYQCGLEMGTQQGWFSRYILENSNIKEWHVVDGWTLLPYPNGNENDKKIAVENLAKFNVNIIQELSNKACLLFEDNFFDFIYIDANHEYEYISEDIKLWWPKLKSGGCFSGHDYGGDWPGVIKAVNDFIKENNLTLNLTGIGSKYRQNGDANQKSWYCIKP